MRENTLRRARCWWQRESSLIMRKHVVFVVDASRSMERRDVFDQGERKRRIDAVLDCCFEFIEVGSACTCRYCSATPCLRTLPHVSAAQSVATNFQTSASPSTRLNSYTAAQQYNRRTPACYCCRAYEGCVLSDSTTLRPSSLKGGCRCRLVNSC